MPDHIHAILWLAEGAATGLQSVVGLFKAGCTRGCRRLGLIPASCPTIWQRGFSDRIIRTEQELAALRRYILENPRLWFERRAG
jgi:REP element-mobilizing transposase RayT